MSNGRSRRSEGGTSDRAAMTASPVANQRCYQSAGFPAVAGSVMTTPRQRGLVDRLAGEVDLAVESAATNTRTCLAVVLAAGEGTRMRSARPKVLHTIA